MQKSLTYSLLLVLGTTTSGWAESPKPPQSPAKSQPARPAPAATLPTPLSADLFQGRARAAYKAAAEMPEVLAQLACYCGCDKSRGHRNLLDCFVDDHGAG